MTGAELRRLMAEAGEELRRREAEEGARRRRERAESAGEGGRWLEHERVNCGRCKRCLEGGRHHGPYWYLYEYAGGKMRSRYVGRRLFADAACEIGRADLADRTPEEAYPEEYGNEANLRRSMDSAIVIVKNPGENNWEGLGTHEFRVLPRRGERIDLDVG